MSTEIALIYNPSAGRGKALRKKKRVEECLRAQNIQYDLFLTESEEHLVETAARVVHRYPVIVGAGGDTSLALIANQILRAKKNNLLGVIPLGTINDLSREIGVLKLVDACRAIKKGRSIVMDVGVVSSPREKKLAFFLVQASLGLGVEVNRYVGNWLDRHNLFSRLFVVAHPFASLKAFYHCYKQRIVPVNLDLVQQETTNSLFTPFVVFSNTSIVAGEFRLSPWASPMDGELDCCVLDAATFPGFLNALVQVKRQTHLENGIITVYRDKTFRISTPFPLEIQADGEIFQTNGEIEISTLPAALKVIVSPDFQPNTLQQVQDQVPASER